ncbi:MAG: zf-HC2 domain-containing protein [Candidatus Onthomonas sp.]
MKLPCSIIEDLLPLYADGVCSPESRAAVEEHVSSCPDCANALRAMTASVEVPAVEADEARPLRAVQAWLKKTRIRAYCLLGLSLAVLVIVLLAAVCALDYTAEINQFTVISVSEIEALEAEESENAAGDPVVSISFRATCRQDTINFVFSRVDIDNATLCVYTSYYRDFGPFTQEHSPADTNESKTYTQTYTSSELLGIRRIVYQDLNGNELLLWERDS